MRALAAGDQTALGRIAERHLNWALRFVERMVGERAHAEDLVQQAFMRVWQAAERWQPDARFRTWFYRVLHNLCLDHFRASGRMETEALDENLTDGTPNAEAHWLRAEQQADIREALQTLAPRQRAAVVLRYYEELSQAEAAALLGISESALESLLTRARSRLRQRLLPTLH